LELTVSLQHYIDAFSNLRRATGPFPAATKHLAPHKPLLLLAVIDMIGRNAITSPFISIAGEMTELASLFAAYWRKVMPVTQASSIAFPFSRLENEPRPFWRVEPLPGKSARPATTISQLRKIAIGALIDKPLFSLLQDQQARSDLIEVLLTSHFSSVGQNALREEMGIQQQAFVYSQALENAALKVKDVVNRDVYSEAVRDQGFRRAIVNCYDHRCAICGTRIVTADGYTAVEAAHIKPWSRFKNDDINNGMALCRLCHWAFDGGMLGVADDFQVNVSRQLTVAPNAPGYLMTLAGREIIRPSDHQLWPAPENLSWHRKEVFMRS
jgi:putative restriction endonuclease